MTAEFADTERVDRTADSTIAPRRASSPAVRRAVDRSGPPPPVELQRAGSEAERMDSRRAADHVGSVMATDLVASRIRPAAGNVIRRYVQFTAQASVPPEQQINSVAALESATGVKVDPATPEGAIIERLLKSPQPVLFADVKEMLAAARNKAAANPFVLKAEESRADSPQGERSKSASSHYNFRNNPQAQLPDAGPDPTAKQKRQRGAATDADAFYYHVTSYTNLTTIFNQGLNPSAGGAVGGSSFQNADSVMNQKSADDSKNKVFVATVGKLTQRYLSFRLRQDDLFGKHSERIVEVLHTNTKMNKKMAEQLFAQVSLGEEPVVLRFANTWGSESWVPDPIDTAAFALVGKAVPPNQIECLTVEGWKKLDVLTAIVQAFPGSEPVTKLRAALLRFYGKHNDTLATKNPVELYDFIETELVKELRVEKFAAK